MCRLAYSSVIDCDFHAYLHFTKGMAHETGYGPSSPHHLGNDRITVRGNTERARRGIPGRICDACNMVARSRLNRCYCASRIRIKREICHHFSAHLGWLRIRRCYRQRHTLEQSEGKRVQARHLIYFRYFERLAQSRDRAGLSYPRQTGLIRRATHAQILLMQGQEKVVPLLRCLFGNRKLIGNQLWPDFPPVIGAKITARDSSMRSTLNCWTAFDRNWSCSISPLIHCGRSNAKKSGKSSLATGNFTSNGNR